MEQNLEEKIISLLMQDPSLVKEVRMALPSECFLSGQLRALYEEIIKYYEFSDGSVPTEEILIELIEKRYPQGSELYRPLLERVAESAAPEDKQHIAYYCAEVEQTWRSNQVQGRMLQAIEAIKERKDIDRAVEILQNEIPVSQNKFIQGDIARDLAAHSQDIKERAKHPEIYGGIPLGFPSLDSNTYGHARGELIVVVGGTGVGKSLTLGQIAINVARRKKKVLLVTVENDKRSYMNRLYSNIAGVEAWKFKSNQLDKNDEERWMKAMGALPEPFNLNVVEFPEGCSARDIWYYMRTLSEDVDYLVVDQITNMFPNNIREHKPMSWLWYGQIALDLKRLSMYAYGNKGIPILSAAQAAGGTVGKKELTTDDIAMAKIIQHHAHAALYITKDEDGQYNMGASKYRDALVRVFPVFPDFKYWRVTEQTFDVRPTDGGTAGPSTSPEPPMQTVPRAADPPAQAGLPESEAFE